MDKRTSTRAGAASSEAAPQAEQHREGDDPEEAAVEPQGEEPMNQAAREVEQAERDLLDDLRRLQAEFDNYRKRMLKEQTAMAARASARLVERLLPVLDNLERAVEHGDGGPGMELVLKDFKQVLKQEGVEEIEAEGVSFDPRLHEAFQVVEDEEVSEPTVKAVYRRGYRVGESVLRAPMVVVAQPAGEARDRGTADASSGEEMAERIEG